MKYLILLSLIFSITFAETTLTDEQLSDLHLKIEQCKLYKEENILLNDIYELKYIDKKFCKYCDRYINKIA